MKQRRTGGKPLRPKVAWPCPGCGQLTRVRWSVMYWKSWLCRYCFSAWMFEGPANV